MLVKDIFQQMGLNYTYTYTLPVNVRIFFLWWKSMQVQMFVKWCGLCPGGGGAYLRIKQTKIDTRFKAKTQKMTPHAGE